MRKETQSDKQVAAAQGALTQAPMGGTKQRPTSMPSSKTPSPLGESPARAGILKSKPASPLAERSSSISLRKLSFKVRGSGKSSQSPLAQAYNELTTALNRDVHLRTDPAMHLGSSGSHPTNPQQPPRGVNVDYFTAADASRTISQETVTPGTVCINYHIPEHENDSATEVTTPTSANSDPPLSPPLSSAASVVESVRSSDSDEDIEFINWRASKTFWDNDKEAGYGLSERVEREFRRQRASEDNSSLASPPFPASPRGSSPTRTTPGKPTSPRSFPSKLRLGSFGSSSQRLNFIRSRSPDSARAQLHSSPSTSRLNLKIPSPPSTPVRTSVNSSPTKSVAWPPRSPTAQSVKLPSRDTSLPRSILKGKQRERANSSPPESFDSWEIVENEPPTPVELDQEMPYVYKPDWAKSSVSVAPSSLRHQNSMSTFQLTSPSQHTLAGGGRRAPPPPPSISSRMAPAIPPSPTTSASSPDQSPDSENPEEDSPDRESPLPSPLGAYQPPAPALEERKRRTPPPPPPRRSRRGLGKAAMIAAEQAAADARAAAERDPHAVSAPPENRMSIMGPPPPRYVSYAEPSTPLTPTNLPQPGDDVGSFISLNGWQGLYNLQSAAASTVTVAVPSSPRVAPGNPPPVPAMPFFPAGIMIPSPYGLAYIPATSTPTATPEGTFMPGAWEQSMPPGTSFPYSMFAIPPGAQYPYAPYLHGSGVQMQVPVAGASGQPVAAVPFSIPPTVPPNVTAPVVMPISPTSPQTQPDEEPESRAESPVYYTAINEQLPQSNTPSAPVERPASPVYHTALSGQTPTPFPTSQEPAEASESELDTPGRTYASHPLPAPPQRSYAAAAAAPPPSYEPGRSGTATFPEKGGYNASAPAVAAAMSTSSASTSSPDSPNTSSFASALNSPVTPTNRSVPLARLEGDRTPTRPTIPIQPVRTISHPAQTPWPTEPQTMPRMRRESQAPSMAAARQRPVSFVGGESMSFAAAVANAQASGGSRSPVQQAPPRLRRESQNLQPAVRHQPHVPPIPERQPRGIVPATAPSASQVMPGVPQVTARIRRESQTAMGPNPSMRHPHRPSPLSMQESTSTVSTNSGGPPSPMQTRGSRRPPQASSSSQAAASTSTATPSRRSRRNVDADAGVDPSAAALVDRSSFVGKVEVQRRRVTKDGITKLKLSLVGVGVDKCGICLSQFREGDWGALGPCRHGFHKRCLANWLVRSRTCPMCRTNLNEL